MPSTSNLLSVHLLPVGGEHKLTYTSGEAERGRSSIYGDGSACRPAQVRLRTCAAFQSVNDYGKELCSPRTAARGGLRLSGGVDWLVDQAKVFGARPAGVQAP